MRPPRDLEAMLSAKISSKVNYVAVSRTAVALPAAVVDAVLPAALASIDSVMQRIRS